MGNEADLLTFGWVDGGKKGELSMEHGSKKKNHSHRAGIFTTA